VINNAVVLLTVGEPLVATVSNVTATNFTVTIQSGVSFSGPLYWLAFSS
jgi:hypothetical protein